MSNKRRRTNRKNWNRSSRKPAHSRVRAQRSLLAEPLEDRRLLSSDLTAWHNAMVPTDVTGDYLTTPRDALMIINHLTTYGSGALDPGATPDMTGGHQMDVNGDNRVSAVDALGVLNELNQGEGGPGDWVEFRLDALDLAGNPLKNAQNQINVKVGEEFVVQVYVQDVRGFTATGVAQAYFDIGYNDDSLFEIIYGETQEIRMDPRTTAAGPFTLTFDGQTTGDIAFASPEQTTENMRLALAGLSNLNAEDIDIKYVPEDEDGTANDNFFVWTVRFIGQYEAQDVPLMTGDFSRTGLSSGTVRDDQITELYPADLTNLGTYRSSFTGGEYYDFLVRAFPESWPGDPDGIDNIFENNGNQFDEVGAFTNQLLGLPVAGAEYQLVSVMLRATASGDLTFLGAPGEDPDFPVYVIQNDDAVDWGLIDTGAPLTITVTQPVNAIDDDFTLAEDNTVALDVLANDFLERDINLKPTLDSIVTAPQHGTATIQNGKVTYKPAAHYFGDDSFVYLAVDGADSDTATVTITVTPVNDAPEAVDDSATTNERVSVLIDVLDNDNPGPLESIPEGGTDSVSIASFGQGQHGTVAQEGDQLRYSPELTFVGTDTFTYTIQDTGNPQLTDTATVTVTVLNVDDPPVASDDTAQTTEDSAGILISVLANDSPGPNDAPQDTMSLVSVGPTSNGGTAQTSGDQILYKPAANEFTTETFTYTMTDSAGVNTSEATVTVTLTPVNDAPDAVNDELFVDEFTTDNVLAVLDNDNPGPLEDTVDSIKIISFTNQHTSDGQTLGSLSITPDGLTMLYTPAPTETGPYDEMFDYTIMDLGGVNGLTDTASVVIHVEPVIRPRARDDQFTMDEGAVGTINVTSNDLFNDTATERTLSLSDAAFPNLKQPEHGTIVIVGSGATAQIQYTPNDSVLGTDFFGTDTFEYVIDDNYVGPDTQEPSNPDVGLVTVTVLNVNDAPTAVADTASTSEEVSILIDVLDNDLVGPGEEEVDALTIQSVGPTSNGGSVAIENGQVRYTPEKDFFGTETFTYTIVDSVVPTLTSTATVTVTVSNVNDGPTAVNDLATTDEEVSVLINVIGNDSAGPQNEIDLGDTLKVIAVSATSGTGSAVIEGNQIRYTPALDFVGTETFTYTIMDLGGVNGLTDTATVTVTVNNVNDPPVANPDTGDAILLALKNFSAQKLDPRANDSVGPDADETFDDLAIVGLGADDSVGFLTTATTAQGGTVTIIEGGNRVEYTPATNFQGTDTFWYRLTDGKDGSFAIAQADIDVVDAVPSNISGTIHLDVDNQGDLDANELRLAGIQVVLTGKNIRNVQFTMEAFTDSKGEFRFEGVLPNALDDTDGYTISAETPEYLLDGQDDVLRDDMIYDENDSLVLAPGSMGNDVVTGIHLGLFGSQEHALGNYIFGERGLRSEYVSIAQYLASSNLGLAVATNMAGDDYWFSVMQGWNGIQSAHVDLANDLATATLKVVDSQGTPHEAQLQYMKNYILAGNKDIGFVVYIKGSAADLGFSLPGEGDLAEGEAPLDPYQLEELRGGDAEQYAQAVDAVFGGGEMA